MSSDAAWRGLLARGALLNICAGQLAELHDLEFSSTIVSGALRDLAKAAAMAQVETTDTAAIRVAAEVWDEAIDTWLALPGSAADVAGCSLLLKVRSSVAHVEEAVDPFAALFGRICTFAADFYNGCWIQPTLNIDDLDTHPRAGKDAYATDAKTSPTKPPVVTLRLFPDGLGPATFSAIPCLLAHECLCHPPANQDRVSNTSSFAEGFMDWAAVDLFGNAVVELCGPLSPAVRAHSNPFRDVFRDPGTGAGRARRLGHIAGENLVVLTVGALGVGEWEARNTVARVARDLNCTAASIRKKDLLVAEFAALTAVGDKLLEVLKAVRSAADLL